MANGPSHSKKLEELSLHAMLTSQTHYATLDLTQRQLIAGNSLFMFVYSNGEASNI